MCGAGAVGCGMRYLIGLWAHARFGDRFPVGTLIVNVVGALLMGLVMELSVRMADFSPNLRFALTSGFLGGLTTYSAFNHETTRLALDGSTLRAGANLALTIVLCLAAGLVGIALARRLAG